jgi:hypothetical protein
MRRPMGVVHLSISARIVEQPDVGAVVHDENPPSAKCERLPDEGLSGSVRLHPTQEPVDDIGIRGSGLVRIEDVSEECNRSPVLLCPCHRQVGMGGKSQGRSEGETPPFWKAIQESRAEDELAAE